MKRLGQVPVNNIQTVTEEVMQKEMESSDSEALLAKSGVVNYLKSRNLYFNSNDVCKLCRLDTFGFGQFVICCLVLQMSSSPNCAEEGDFSHCLCKGEANPR